MRPATVEHAPGGAARHSRAAALPIAIAALVSLRLAYWLLAPPNSDEAYYWLWGLHPDLSYFDHPPLNAWIQGLFHAALGRSTFVLRLPAALTTAGSVALVARLARRLRGGAGGVGTVACAALLASPLLLMLTSFAWQDHLLVFLALLSASLLLDFLADVESGARGSTARLLGGAAALGAAALAKYSAVFLALGLVVSILLGRRPWRLLLDPRLWLAGALCLAILSPVLAWNVRNGFASFHFHLVEQRGLASGLAFSPKGTLHFVAPTLLLISPALAWAMITGMRENTPAAPPYAVVYRRLALAVFASSSLVFLAISLFSVSQYYWNVVAYLLLVPPAALQLARRRRLLAAHLGTGVAVASVMVVHATVLPLSALVPGVGDEDSREPWGWEQVAAAARTQARVASARRFAATDYRPGAHLAFALGDPDVAVLSGRRSQFDYWPGLARGAAAILVSDARSPVSPSIRARFERLEKVAVVPVARLGVQLKEYELWRAEGFRGGGSGP